MNPQLHSWVRGGLVIVATTLLVAARHPMHTAVAELSYDARRGTTAILIRVFADDWAAAVPVPPGTPGADSAMARYVRDRFTLADRSGRDLPLQWESGERAGDVVVLRLHAAASAGLGGAQVTSALLCERFEDQVNIVRATYRGRTTTLLFTRGDGSKTLP